MRHWAIVVMIGACWGSVARVLAGIPEPDAIIYGTVTMDGAIVGPLDQVAIVARLGAPSQAVGQFRFDEPLPTCVGSAPTDDCNRNCIEDACDIRRGDGNYGECGKVVGHGTSDDIDHDGVPDECPGDHYVLRIRLETLVGGETQRSANTALIGDTVSLFARVTEGGEVREIPLYPHEFHITERGLVQERNLSTAVSLLQSMPAENGSLWRAQRNLIQLVFPSADLPVPGSGELLIQELLPQGQFGENLNAGSAFNLSMAPFEGGGGALRIAENGAVLQNRKWYAIRNAGAWSATAPFRVNLLVQVGDSSGNRIVTNADVLQINAAPNGAVPPGSRLDLDGNGFKTNADVLIANARSPSPDVPKPSGH